jgi:hypothetical protein
MARPILLGVNLLETPGVTLTVTGEDAGYPKTNLFDRDASAPYKDTSASGTRILHVDQGASGTQAVSGWGIASTPLSTHNLTGASLSLESSPDNSAWTVRDSLTPSSTDTLARTIASLVARYWRLTITGAGAAPQVPEWLLSQAFSLSMGPSDQEFTRGRRPNHVTHEALSGQRWSVVRGPRRWVQTYSINDLTTAEQTAWLAFYEGIQGGALPFLLLDEDGVARWARLVTADLPFRALVLRWGLPLAFEQEL